MTIEVTVIAIWTENGWIELRDRAKWPRGHLPVYVITEMDPGLGERVCGREVLAAHALEELANEFGEAFLVVGVPPRA